MVADPEAEYDETIEIDLSLLEPLVACPGAPDNVKKVSEIEGIPVNQVIVGSSANSSFRDLMITAKAIKTRFPGVYAIGDVTSVGTPKAGVFSEGAARVVAASLIAELQGGEQPPAYTGAGSCYIEFGGGRIARVDVDFLSGSSATGIYYQPSDALTAEKEHFGATRRARWFGLE